MRSVIKTAKTVEEAIASALAELEVEKDDTTIEILDEPSKGFLGFIGGKDAKVKITVTNDPVDMAKNFFNDILNKMNIKAIVNIEKKKNQLNIEVEGINDKDMGILIGKRGNTLDAIQYLISLTINKNREKYIKVMLDIENYREKRKETLIRLAKKMASKVKRERKRLRLEPMNPYERRVIHSALQRDPEIETHSEGEEPFRRVVIEFKR